MFEKKISTGNVYFASIRKGMIKELCSIYKVFLLLNECGDPPFFISKFKFPEGNQHFRQTLAENLCSVLFRGNDLKSKWPKWEL